ncbi:hypothetical protein ACFL0V_01745 [Nanoarchaeota archaeon]
MVTLTHVFEGLRMFKRNLRIKRKGYPRYKGNSEQICGRILEKCWNGEYFQVSAGHYNEFYARDFGWCARYLLELGQKQQMIATMKYALGKYSIGGIKTAINPGGNPFNFPNYYCIDGVAYVFHVLRLLKDEDLIDDYREFLTGEVARFVKEVMDKDIGMVRKDRYFSSQRDHSLRSSSCYDNTMVAFLDKELSLLKFDNPLKEFRMKKRVKEEFWTGDYFKNESSDETVTGDSNVVPFWTGVFDDKKMIRKMIGTVRKEGLDKPFPLKYVHKVVPHKTVGAEMFVKDWEQDTVWAMMGMMFVDVVSLVDKNQAKKYLKQYTQVIKRYGNFLEVYDNSGNPFETMWYSCDDSMSWASMYLGLKGRLKA